MTILRSSAAVLLLTLLVLLSIATSAHAATYPTPTVTSISSSAQDDSSGLWYHGTVTFTASASDPSGLNSLSLVYDDGSSPTTVAYDAVSGTSATETFQLDTTNVPDGDDCFYVQAVGRGSQSAQTDDFCVQISNTTPGAVSGLTYNPSNPNTTWQNESSSDVVFSEPTNEPDGDLPGNVLYTVNGGAVQSTTDEGGEAQLPNLPDGNDNVCLWLQDLAGNSDASTQQCVTVPIDNATPTVGPISYKNQGVSFGVAAGPSGISSIDVEVVQGNNDFDLGGSVSGSTGSASFKQATPGTWTATIDIISNSDVEEIYKEKFTVPEGTLANKTKPSIIKPKKVKVGAAFRSKPGTWAGSHLSYSYQWQVKKSGKWKDIAKATKSSFKIAKAEKGKDVRLGVKAKDATAESGWVYSKAVKA